jgi:hypothetical protein
MRVLPDPSTIIPQISARTDTDTGTSTDTSTDTHKPLHTEPIADAEAAERSSRTAQPPGTSSKLEAMATTEVATMATTEAAK